MKEPLLAIAIGFIIGLVITFGIWTANKSLKQVQNGAIPTPTIGSNATPEPASPTPAPSIPTSFEITTPENESITNTSSITLEGTAIPGSTVAIFGGSTEQILITDSKGKFTTEVNLESGYNLFHLTATTQNGTSTTKTLTITYTTTKI
jgi:hypothetical protein